LKKLANNFNDKNSLSIVNDVFNEFFPEIRQIYNAILPSDFRVLITTNFDNNIITTINLWQKSQDYNIIAYPVFSNLLDNEKMEILPLSKKNIIYIHGLIEKDQTYIEDIVLGSNNFEIAYEKTYLKNILIHLFTNYNFLFYGFNIEEPEIKAIIEKSNDLLNQRKIFMNRYKKHQITQIRKYTVKTYNKKDIQRAANKINITPKELINQKIREDHSNYFIPLIYNSWNDFDKEFISYMESIAISKINQINVMTIQKENPEVN
jgi:hypothetical protein